MPTRLWASTSNLLSLGRSSIHGLISARGETCPESRSGFRDRALPRHPAHPGPEAQVRHNSRYKSVGAAPPQGHAVRAHSRVSARLSRNARDTWAGVFTVSTDQSPWRQEMVNSDSTGLVIARPPEIFAATEFIPSGVDVKEGCADRAIHELLKANFRRNSPILRKSSDLSKNHRHRIAVERLFRGQ